MADAVAEPEPDARNHPLYGLRRLTLLFRDRLERKSLLVPQFDELCVARRQRLSAPAQRRDVGVGIVAVAGGFGPEALGEALAVGREAPVLAARGAEFLPQPVPRDGPNPRSEV